VPALRRVLTRHPHAAALLLLAALLLRLLVPSGFMPVVADGRPALAACDGVAPVAVAAGHHVRAGHGGGHRAADATHHHSGAAPCAFADLATPSLAGVPPLLPTPTLTFDRPQDSAAAPLFLAASARPRPPARAPPRSA
jgi:hypothetical protein